MQRQTEFTIIPSRYWSGILRLDVHPDADPVLFSALSLLWHRPRHAARRASDREQARQPFRKSMVGRARLVSCAAVGGRSSRRLAPRAGLAASRACHGLAD